MEIRHFVTFKKVIESGSFTQAADHLGYTQSTVTSHIQAHHCLIEWVEK
jgi:DNA-binding transcriptional LysR family regulator